MGSDTHITGRGTRACFSRRWSEEQRRWTGATTNDTQPPPLPHRADQWAVAVPTYRTNVPAAMVLAMLAAHIDEDKRAFTLSGYAGRRRFIGRIRDGRFELYPRPHFRNPFARHMYGSIEDTQDGSILVTAFRMPALSRIYLALFFGGSAVLFVALLLLSYARSSLVASLEVAASVLVIAACGLFIVGISRLLGIPAERSMVRFLQRTLASHLVSSDER